MFQLAYMSAFHNLFCTICPTSIPYGSGCSARLARVSHLANAFSPLYSHKASYLTSKMGWCTGESLTFFHAKKMFSNLTQKKYITSQYNERIVPSFRIFEQAGNKRRNGLTLRGVVIGPITLVDK